MDNILNVELISKNRIQKDNIDDIRYYLESNDDYLSVYSRLAANLEINFDGFLMLYIEQMDMDEDLRGEVPNIIQDLEDLIPGGFSNDSKIEWLTSLPEETITVWYKDDEWIEKNMKSDSNPYHWNVYDRDSEDEFTNESKFDWD